MNIFFSWIYIASLAFIKYVIISIGKGKTIVEFFSADIVLRVCVISKNIHYSVFISQNGNDQKLNISLGFRSRLFVTRRVSIFDQFKAEWMRMYKKALWKMKRMKKYLKYENLTQENDGVIDNNFYLSLITQKVFKISWTSEDILKRLDLTKKVW